MNRLLLLIPLAVAGCDPPGQSTRELTGGYEWRKHDGESQIVRADGNITLEHVEDARAEGAMIHATVENGAALTVDSRTGEVRRISGETQ